MAGKTANSKKQLEHYEQSIAQDGLRLTRQRRHVYEVLLGRQDHPTAMEVFLRAKPGMETLSLATVYNTLETLAARGLGAIRGRAIINDTVGTLLAAAYGRHHVDVASICGTDAAVCARAARACSRSIVETSPAWTRKPAISRLSS